MSAPSQVRIARAERDVRRAEGLPAPRRRHLRTGRLTDGWLVRRSHYAAMSGERREQDFEYRLGRIREAARASGRDPALIAVVCPIDASGERPPDEEPQTSKAPNGA